MRGKTVETEEFLPAYCAVAMAGLGNLPDTILARSVVIKCADVPRTKRLDANPTDAAFMQPKVTVSGSALRSGLPRLRRPRNMDPPMPDGVCTGPRCGLLGTIIVRRRCSRRRKLADQGPRSRCNPCNRF